MQAAPPHGGDFMSGNAAYVPTPSANGTNVFRVLSQMPDLMNGDINSFAFIFVSAGLEDQWRWMEGAIRLPLVEPVTDASIKATVCREAMLHARLLIGQGMAEATAVTSGLILAMGRVTIRRAWRIVDDDIVTTQLKTFATPPAFTAAGALTANHSVLGTIPEWAATLTVLNDKYDLLADTHLGYVAQAALGMPACNGITIVQTLVHHYVDPHKQICDAVVEQLWPDPIIPPTPLTLVELKDIVCHKTAHPIASPVLVWMARSLSVKARLKAVGLGAAVVRLPAEFPPEKTASAMRALVHRAAEAGRAANVVFDVTAVDTFHAAVKAAIIAAPNQTGVTAAEVLVEDFKIAHSHAMAWGAGFLDAMFTATRGSERAKSVIKAYCITTLVDEHSPAHAEGADHYDLATRWRRAQAKSGKLAGYGFMGAAAPKAFGDAEATPKTGGP